MKIKANIPDQDIIDCLVTALEGGSNYWYNMPDLTMLRSYKEALALSERVAMSALDGENIPVYDIEDEEELLGFISKANIEQGIKLFVEDGREFDPGMDADEADVLFQFIVMGEVVYG